MHITVQTTGEVTVFASRRVAAHLWGTDLTAPVEITSARLVASGLVRPEEEPALLRLARDVAPVDVAGWQIVLAALRSPAQAVSAAVRAYARVRGMRVQPVRCRLAAEARQEQAVMVYRLGGG